MQLQPDLILGSKVGTDKIYRQLSGIAPTVLAADSGRAGDWQKHFQLYAEALGKADEAKQLLQDYQDQVQQLQQTLERPQDLEISVLSSFENRIGAYTTGSFSGSVLQDIGFARTSAQDLTRRYALELSPEALTDLDGDFIFLIYGSHFSGGIR